MFDFFTALTTLFMRFYSTINTLISAYVAHQNHHKSDTKAQVLKHLKIV